jgi:hypothetical protein
MSFPDSQDLLISIREGPEAISNGIYKSMIVNIEWKEPEGHRYELFLAIGGNEMSHRGCFNTDQLLKHQTPCEARWNKDWIEVYILKVY